MASPQAPQSASAFYKTLYATAVELIQCQDKTSTKPEGMDFDRVRAIRSETGFEHSWGHNYLVSTNPIMAATHDVDGFVKHISSMLPKLESWKIDITEVIVDEYAKRAIVRASYWMRPKGSDAPLENDIVWFLDMDEDGKRVKKSVEFMDGAAVNKTMEIMMSQLQKTSG